MTEAERNDIERGICPSCQSDEGQYLEESLAKWGKCPECLEDGRMDEAYHQ